ncbi:hypothetical protein ACIA59_09455 [Micromonospora haikouensis]|uniref:hypothetical protein n=1 Tax=Micromonospora haikouensis TaxID=686309 RepID=UPI003787E02A
MSNADPAPRTTVQAPRVAHVDPAIGIGEPVTFLIVPSRGLLGRPARYDFLPLSFG